MKRDAFTMQLGFGHEIIADNFAGGGGASEAIRLAYGRDPDVAINHNGEALCMHHANHPTTKHYREDVFLINPTLVTGNQTVAGVWFSPTCTHFSKAKGFNILDQTTRGLAWVVFKWAVPLAPRLMFLENVEEFMGWGPLDAAGRPIKEHKGRTFQAFVAALTTGLSPDHPDAQEISDTLGADFPMYRLFAGLGYKVEWRVLRACDFGAGTIRKRLFMVMRRDGLAIRWPAPTHGDPKSVEVKSGKLLPFVTAADCIDWSIPCRSIFDRKKDLADATLRRVGRGFERYVKDAARPFIVPLTHQGADRVNSIDDPVPTITCANRGELALVAATMVQTGYGEAPGQQPHALALTDPLGTVVAGGVKHALVAASLVQYYTGGSQNQPVDGPMPTIVTKDRVGVTCAYLAKHYKGVIGASVEQPMPTVTTSDHTSVIAVHIQRDMGKSVGHAVDAPLGTVTAGGGGKSALVAAHLVGIDNKSNGPASTWAADDPLTTITTENRHAVVTSNLVKLRGTSTAAPVDAPLGTASAGGTHHAEVRTTLARTPASLQRREQVRAFLREYCPSLKDAEFPELVTINGEVMEVVDIGLRMLAPRELANAQGFRPDYILDPLYTSMNKRGKTVTKRLSGSAQVRMIGNSVSPPPAAAVLLANNSHERELAVAA
jgi:DNA (cytosine-5)-methyltransferase 1